MKSNPTLRMCSILSLGTSTMAVDLPSFGAAVGEVSSSRSRAGQTLVDPGEREMDQVQIPETESQPCTSDDRFQQ